ncbi:alpha/beta hydrolase fold domain-containing protein [Nocardia thailandica]
MHTEAPPFALRVLHALRPEPDWDTVTAADLARFRDAAERTVNSPLARLVSGFPNRHVTIDWRRVPLPDREIPVRVYRPRRAPDATLPLVVHVHGGGFVGTATQCDWANSHLAAALPALVVSVEHRLLDERTSIADAADDGWQVLAVLAARAADWGVDPARIAVAGESTGALIAALAALRATAAGLALRAQVLVNPATDLTETLFEHDSLRRYPHTPTLSVPKMRVFRRLAVPPGADARAVSPLHADVAGVAPALVIVPRLDPLADHGRRYAEHLRAAGVAARVAEYPGAPHAFLTLPGLVRGQARAARAAITAFLDDQLDTRRPGPSSQVRAVSRGTEMD